MVKVLAPILTLDVREYSPVGRSKSATTRWSIAMPKTRYSGHCRMNGDTVVVPNPPASPWAPAFTCAAERTTSTPYQPPRSCLGLSQATCVKLLMLFTAPASGTAFPDESVVVPSCAASPICSATNPGPAGASRKLVSPRLTAGSETWLSPSKEVDWRPISIATLKSLVTVPRPYPAAGDVQPQFPITALNRSTLAVLLLPT